MKHDICVVPGCKTSPISDPNVKFISFPRNELKRKLWFDTLSLSSKIPKTRRMHVCEKHFELETDLKDYEKFKSGVGYLKLKDGVVPHLNLATPTSCEVDYESMYFSANNSDIGLEGRMSVASMSSGYHSLQSGSRMSTTTEFNDELHQIIGDVSERNQILNDGYHLEPIESPTPISSTEETQTLEDFFVNSSDIDMQGRISVDSLSSVYYSSQCESRMSTTTECNMALHHTLGDAYCEHNQTCLNNCNRHEQMETLTPIVLNKETQTDYKQFFQSLSIKETQNETVSKKSVVRSKGVQHNIITWPKKDAASSPCWKGMPLLATSPVLKLMSSQSSTLNPSYVTAQDFNSPSPIKCTSPQQSWQISSTPLSAKRKVIDPLAIDTSSHGNVRKKRKCARYLSYEETSSNKGDTSSCGTSRPKEDSSWHQSFTSNDTSVLHSPLSFVQCTTEFKLRSRQRAIQLMECDPRTYLGVDRDWISVLLLVGSKFKVKGNLTSLHVIYLVLRKLRLNESFVVFGHEFGISYSQASRYFTQFLPLISSYFRQLIVWPNDESIHRAMPIGFRKSFKKVSGVGDCLEIAIQKPVDAFEQALTWSDYKKANTIKFYVVITPNGLFSFCSAGYGGRATDEMIVSHCGFLDLLKRGMVIMLDRGFKKVQSMVLEKGCEVVRPPSVSEGKQLSKEQVLTGRKIAGVRIHVERAIRHIREFKFLAPHACIHNSLVSCADDAFF